MTKHFVKAIKSNVINSNLKQISADLRLTNGGGGGKPRSKSCFCFFTAFCFYPTLCLLSLACFSLFFKHSKNSIYTQKCFQSLVIAGICKKIQRIVIASKFCKNLRGNPKIQSQSYILMDCREVVPTSRNDTHFHQKFNAFHTFYPKFSSSLH